MVNEGGTASFTVTYSGFGPSATVRFTVESGSAAGGSDFTAVSGNLTMDTGETRQISVPIFHDFAYEADEYFVVRLTSSDSTVDDAVGLALIRNDDSLPTLSIANVTVTEGNSGTSNAAFTVTRSGAAGVFTTVDYATVDVTALAGSDYTGVSGTLSFAPNESTIQISVPVIGDTSVESTETFILVLAYPTNADIIHGEATGTIVNNDV
jgi:hypothetical protein